MKHPISVEELLELHHLGELYVKWASSPVAMSEQDLERLQAISARYSVDGTSALFAFQKQFQHEFGLTAHNTVSVQELAREVVAAAQEHEQAPIQIKNEVRTPREDLTRMLRERADGLVVNIEHAWYVAHHLGYELRGFYEHWLTAAKKLWPGEATWFQLKMEQLGVEPFGLEVQSVWISDIKQVLDSDGVLKDAETRQPMAIPATAEDLARLRQKLQESLEADERNEALREQIHEDNEVDRDSMAQDRAEELREALTTENFDVERELSILREISNVDELTFQEAARLDQLVERRQLAQDSGTHKIPNGVVQDAMDTGHIERVK